MSLYNDLTTVLTPYANKIKQNESDIGDIQDALEHLDVETDKTLSVDGKPADAKAVGDEIADLKEDFRELNGISPISWTIGEYFDTSSGSVDITSPTSNQSWMSAVVSCTADETFTINAYGGNGPRAYAFINSSGVVLKRARSQDRLVNTVVTAPLNAAYLIINNQNNTSSKDYVSFVGKIIDLKQIETITKKLYDEKNLTPINTGFFTLVQGVTEGRKYSLCNYTNQNVSISMRSNNTTVEIITNSLNVGACIEFTVSQDADSLSAYISNTPSGYFKLANMESIVLELKEKSEEIETKQQNNENIINELLNPVKNSSELWVLGSYTYGGNPVSADDRYRTVDFIPDTIRSVLLRDRTFSLYVFGWNESGVCVGFWRKGINAWENNNSIGLASVSSFNIDEMKKLYPGYKYKLVLHKTGIVADNIANAVEFGHYIPVLGEVRRRPLLTFIDDDGYAQSGQIWEDISKTCNIPVTMALVTANIGVQSYALSWEDVKRLQNIGFEFVSHTHNHIWLNDPNITSETTEQDFVDTITALENHNCESKFLVYPYTTSSAENRELVRKYFSCGISLQNALNEPYVDKTIIRRYDINSGTGEMEIDGSTVTVHLFRTLDNIKSIIDNAVLHNGWIIFMSHLRNTYNSDQYYYNNDVKQLIIDTVEYARSKNVEVVTVKDGYKMYRPFMY